MDPSHTGFTSSDSEPEITRRADVSNNTSLTEFLATSPLKKAGKANSTVWQHGRNFADYSYAAGYSTIKSSKIDRLSKSAPVPSTQKIKSVRQKPVNSTLIGAKYAKDVTDLTQSPNTSPIAFHTRRRRTVPTFVSPPSNVATKNESLVQTAHQSAYGGSTNQSARRVSKVPDEDNWMTVTESATANVPVAYSTPLHSKPIFFDESAPSQISDAEYSEELHPNSTSRFIHSMFDENDSSSMVARGEHLPDIQECVTDTRQSMTDGRGGSNDVGSQTEFTQSMDMQQCRLDTDKAYQTQYQGNSITEWLRVANERTPQQTSAIKMNDDGSDKETDCGLLSVQRELHFSSLSTNNTQRLAVDIPASSGSDHPTRENARIKFTASSPVLVSPSSRQHFPQNCIPAQTSNAITSQSDVPVTQSEAPSYAAGMSSDSVTQDDEMDSGTEAVATNHSNTELMETELIDHNSFSYSPQPVKSQIKGVQLNYPPHIQLQMDEINAKFKKRNPTQYEATKHIPCDILTCSFVNPY